MKQTTAGTMLYNLQEGQKARVLCLARDKHSSLLGLHVSYKEIYSVVNTALELVTASLLKYLYFEAENFQDKFFCCENTL